MNTSGSLQGQVSAAVRGPAGCLYLPASPPGPPGTGHPWGRASSPSSPGQAGQRAQPRGQEGRIALFRLCWGQARWQPACCTHSSLSGGRGGPRSPKAGRREGSGHSLGSSVLPAPRQARGCMVSHCKDSAVVKSLGSGAIELESFSSAWVGGGRQELESSSASLCSSVKWA